MRSHTIIVRAKDYKPKRPIIISNTVKYIVRKGSDTFEKLSAVKARIEEANTIIRALISEFGATEYLSGGSEYIAGNLRGIRFDKKPDNWKQVEANYHFNCFFPKSNKQNKQLLERIAAIPKVESDDLNKCVAFKRQWFGLTRLNRIGATWGDEFILVEVAEEATYEPLADMEELTNSEFKRLKEELNAKEEVQHA